MNEKELLTQSFERHRDHLRSVAYRMLGSMNEAEDALQETWLRLNRSGADEVENLGGWLTTVVARVCLDILRSRKSRREEPLSDLTVSSPQVNPEEEAMLADTVGPALLLVLETLAPAERIAFILHDVFAVSFEEIAPIVGRSPVATRQLASRGRRRVQGASATAEADAARQRRVVDAFLTASRDGDFEALLVVLDPDVIVRADATVIQIGSPKEIRGAEAVAKTFKGRARAAKRALVDGVAGAAWIVQGKPKVVFGFTFSGDRIVALDLIGDAEQIAELELVFLD